MHLIPITLNNLTFKFSLFGDFSHHLAMYPRYIRLRCYKKSLKIPIYLSNYFRELVLITSPLSTNYTKKLYIYHIIRYFRDY